MRPRPSRARLGAGLVILLAQAAVACSADDGGTTVTWIEEPTPTIALGDSIAPTWMVETSGTLHVAILGGCAGEVADCGPELFDVETYADTEQDGPLTASVTPDSAGPWTLVVWVHVDEDPHLSDPVTVQVDP